MAARILLVEDTGIGIAPEKIDQLFEEFTQADTSTTREYGGTGLGLAITKKLVHLMGGRIAAQSAEGCGSQFQVTLPMRSATTEVIPRGAGLAGKRIAVLEPSDLLRQAVEATALDLGLRSVRVEDYDEADLLVLSSELDASECEVARRVAERRHIPCPVLKHRSGESQQSQVLRGLPEISLPLERAKVREQLRALLGEASPAGKREPGGNEAQVEESPLAWLAPWTEGWPILLVEDNRVNARVARAFLERAGLNVVHVENGWLAVERVQEEDFALVLMDCQMPVLDGYAATQAIRALPGPVSQVKIVAMTAHAMAGDRERCLEAGMDDYVTKPLLVPELARTLRALLTRRAA